MKSISSVYCACGNLVFYMLTNWKSVIALIFYQENFRVRVPHLLFTAGKKPSLLARDSDDDGEANTYDYTDSFIDDQNVGGKYNGL